MVMLDNVPIWAMYLGLVTVVLMVAEIDFRTGI